MLENNVLDYRGNVANFVRKKFKIMFHTALHFFRSKLQELQQYYNTIDVHVHANMQKVANNLKCV
jgi:hypothetical protein